MKTDLDIKEIAKEVRTRLAKEFSKCKFSVSIQRYAGGQSLHVSLMSGPFDAFAQAEDTNGNIRESDYAQLNHFQFNNTKDDEYISNGSYLTKTAFNIMARVYSITREYNWDNSEPQTDYFDVHFYVHLNIGQWDKPFVRTYGAWKTLPIEKRSQIKHDFIKAIILPKKNDKKTLKLLESILGN